MFDSLDEAVLGAMAEAARRAIMPRFNPGHSLEAAYKSVGEAVTAADQESEAILAEALAGLIPGAAIVGEEATHHSPNLLEGLASGTSWIIDPLDGTSNFAGGQSPFGVLVALAVDGIPEAGWILDPVSGRKCVARRGRGATIDVIPFKVPAMDCDALPVVAVTQLFADKNYRDGLIANLSESCRVIDSPRCAADQYPRVAMGIADATLFTRTIAWDHAAGVIFLTEAGGMARRLDGSAYRCDVTDGGMVVATCPRRWELVAGLVVDAGFSLAGRHLVVD